MFLTEAQTKRIQGSVFGAILAASVYRDPSAILRGDRIVFEVEWTEELLAAASPKMASIASAVLQDLAEQKHYSSPGIAGSIAKIINEDAEFVGLVDNKFNRYTLLVSLLTVGFMSLHDDVPLSATVREIGGLTGQTQEEIDAVTIFALMLRETILWQRIEIIDKIHYLPEEGGRQTVTKALGEQTAESFRKMSMSATESLVGATHEVKNNKKFIDAFVRGFLLVETNQIIRLDTSVMITVLSAALHGSKRWAREVIAEIDTKHLSLEAISEAIKTMQETEPDGEWSGNSAEKKIKRALSNVVSRHRSLVRTADFKNAKQIEIWLNDYARFATSEARFTALMSQRTEEIDLDRKDLFILNLGIDHFHAPETHANISEECKNAKPRLYSTESVDPDGDTATWFNNTFNLEKHPEISGVFDGNKLIAMHNRWSVLKEGAEKIGIEDASFQIWVKQNRIVYINMNDKGGYLPAHATDSYLFVEFDDDGASVVLKAYPTEKYDKQISKDAVFYGIWGDWLDNDNPLSDKELKAGIEKAEQFIAAEISKQKQTRK